ncbi:MAG: glycoside hydrolase family 25 protein [Clostridium sp.]|uniref:glycoside hydrolase family 25 protein n=1 Tax=Clostridium sp. TaxID=1506 RepID=UPI003F322A98
MQNKNNNSLFLIDLNEYTQNPNFSVLKEKAAGIYLRTSGSGSGSFRLDKKFVEFAKICKQNGIKTGGYHYGIPSYNLATADSQCDDFINALQEGYGKRFYGDFMPVLDIEEPTTPKMNTDVLLKWIDRFRKRFEKKTRRRLMLYVSVNFVQVNNNFKLSNGTYPLNNMPLWIAMYTWIKGNPEFPPNVGGWTKWRMWQYTDKEKVEGVDNLVDANYGPNNLELLMQPGNVQNFSGKVNKGNVCLTWTKNKDIDLGGYNIFVDNYWIGTVDANITNYNIPIVKLYKPYGRNIVLSIEAFDIEGNVSQVRSKINLTI